MVRMISQFEVSIPDDVRRIDADLDDDDDNVGDGNIGIGMRANVAGVVAVKTLEGGSATRIVTLAAGESVALFFTRVLTTGTTSTGIDVFTVKLKGF